MIRSASVLLVLSLLAVARAQAQPSCPVPGELMHWQADYCMYKEGTDDFFQDGVQQCFEREGKKVHKDDCAAKAEYKRAICRMVSSFPPYNGSSKKCLEDNSFAGPTVRGGGV